MMRVDSYIFKNGWNREIDITKDFIKNSSSMLLEIINGSEELERS